MSEDPPAVNTTADANANAGATPGTNASDAASITPPDSTPPPDATASAADANAVLDDAAIDELLKQASFEDPSGAIASSNGSNALDSLAGAEAAANAQAGEPFPLPNFQQVMADAQVSSIDLLRDVELNVKIELGRSRMLVEDVLKLGEGSVVELDKLAGDPVDVFVNDRLVARGEVLVLNENFCVRVNEIVAGVREEN